MAGSPSGRIARHLWVVLPTFGVEVKNCTAKLGQRKVCHPQIGGKSLSIETDSGLFSSSYSFSPSWFEDEYEEENENDNFQTRSNNLGAVGKSDKAPGTRSDLVDGQISVFTAKNTKNAKWFNGISGLTPPVETGGCYWKPVETGLSTHSIPVEPAKFYTCVSLANLANFAFRQLLSAKQRSAYIVYLGLCLGVA